MGRKGYIRGIGWGIKNMALAGRRGRMVVCFRGIILVATSMVREFISGLIIPPTTEIGIKGRFRAKEGTNTRMGEAIKEHL